MEAQEEHVDVSGVAYGFTTMVGEPLSSVIRIQRSRECADLRVSFDTRFVDWRGSNPTPGISPEIGALRRPGSRLDPDLTIGEDDVNP
jgi:hypothetical protein